MGISLSTCADDILLLSNSPQQLQGMLDVAYSYSNIHKYEIHPEKSIVTRLVKGRQNGEPNQWLLGSETISIADKFTHLGLTWQREEHIKGARRMAYSLMRIGLHGVDGLGPSTSMKILKTYVIPKLLQSTDAVALQQKEIHTLETYYRKLLRQL